jgi:hypothetical protein
MAVEGHVEAEHDDPGRAFAQRAGDSVRHVAEVAGGLPHPFLVAAEIDWFGESLSTKLAVARDTPLAAATSFSVTRFGSLILSLLPGSRVAPTVPDGLQSSLNRSARSI